MRQAAPPPVIASAATPSLRRMTREKVVAHKEIGVRDGNSLRAASRRRRLAYERDRMTKEQRYEDCAPPKFSLPEYRLRRIEGRRLPKDAAHDYWSGFSRGCSGLSARGCFV